MNYEALVGTASIAVAGLYVLTLAFERSMRPAFRVAFVFVAIGSFTIDAGMFVMAFFPHHPHYETMPLVFLSGLIGAGIGFAGMGIMAWDTRRTQAELKKKWEDLADRTRSRIARP